MATRLTALESEVMAHPWRAIAIAFAAGAWVAFDRTGGARRAVLSSIGSAALGTLRDAIHPTVERAH